MKFYIDHILPINEILQNKLNINMINIIDEYVMTDITKGNIETIIYCN